MPKTTKPKLNVRLLRKIQKHILEEPRRFFMGGLIATAQPGSSFEIWYKDIADIAPPCGTAACIAGWTRLLSGKTATQARRLMTFRYDVRVLGLPSRFANDWESPLFYASEWPEPFRTHYNKAKTPKTRAKIACERIDYLIAEGK